MIDKDKIVAKQLETSDRILELEVLVASLQQQLKVAREKLAVYQKRRKWDYDHLDYEEDRDR